jgi:hypothetical protein
MNEVERIYNSGVDSLMNRTQVNRTIHMRDLQQVYMNGLKHRANNSFLTMMENMIAERDVFNTNKMVMDAADLSHHEQRVNAKRHLSGGTTYASKRYNQLYVNALQKLTHDRSIHTQEMQQVLASTPPGPLKQFVHTLTNERAVQNNIQMKRDAHEWDELEHRVRKVLGNSQYTQNVLDSGVSQALRGGNSDITLRDIASRYAYSSGHTQKPFSNQAASDLYSSTYNKFRIY